MRRGKIITAGVLFLVAAVAVIVLRSRSEIPVDVFEARKGPIEEIVTAVSAGRRRFTDRVYRWIVGTCALFLFFFAVSFGYFGMTKLFRLL